MTGPRPLLRWWAITLGFLLCFPVGFIQLWLRRDLSTGRRWVLTAVAAATLGALGIAGALTPPAETPAAAPAGGTPSASTSPSPVASPSPSVVPSPMASAPSKAPANGTALAALSKLRVAGRGPMTGYSRDVFGPAWADTNRNGCDTRNDILKRDLTGLRFEARTGRCKVLSGVRKDPYTGSTIRFVYGGASEIDIDHVVSLGNAWVTGAARWPYAKQIAVANDPLNLLAVSASANRQKGDGDAATWLPSNKAYRCNYVARQISVKAKYGLYVTAPEKAAMERILAKCPDQPLLTGGNPTKSTVLPARPGSAPKTTPKAGGSTDPRFATCGEAIAAGYGPYLRGKDPEYAWYEDRDGDGVVCE